MPSLSRRTLLRGAPAAAAATLATPRAAAAASKRRSWSPGQPGPRLVVDDPDLHLLRRFTYGPTRKGLDAVRSLGRHAWFEQQLAPDRISDPGPAGWLAAYPLAGASPTTIRAASGGKRSLLGVDHLVSATIIRARSSRRQLFESLVEMWHDHLHVYGEADAVWDLLGQRDAGLRQRAMGTFEELLTFSTRDPAMLRYLNQDTSRGSKPNENLGREMLELHTLGVGNYTEDDVHNAALALTGLTVAADGTATVNPAYHYVGPLAVAGWSHPNPDRAGADTVISSLLSHLARHPATARHVATRIARRYVTDTPSVSLVEALAHSYLTHGTSIVPVLRTLMQHKDFSASLGHKTRRPYESVIFALRALDVGFEGADPLHDLRSRLSAMGHLPFQWPAPDGFPDTVDAWASAGGHLQRWNFQRDLVDGEVRGLAVPRLASTAAVSNRLTAVEVVDRVSSHLLLQHVSDHHRKVIHLSAGQAGHQRFRDLSRLPGVVAAVLGSPYAEVR